MYVRVRVRGGYQPQSAFIVPFLLLHEVYERARPRWKVRGMHMGPGLPRASSLRSDTGAALGVRRALAMIVRVLPTKLNCPRR